MANGIKLNGIKITELENKVLRDLFVSADGNGHDFGFTDEVTCIAKKSVPGVIASLSQKGIIVLHEDRVNGRMIVQFTWGNVTPEQVEKFISPSAEPTVAEILAKQEPAKQDRNTQLAAARDAYFKKMGFGKYKQEKKAAKPAANKFQTGDKVKWGKTGEFGTVLTYIFNGEQWSYNVFFLNHLGRRDLLETELESVKE